MKSYPLTFEPIFVERVWGGRTLETLFAKKLPPQKRIGESWEIVDRPEAQSMVQAGPYRGRSLHDLWINERLAIFGKIFDAPRFPLLIKLLDCYEKLSLQVHPPPHAAAVLGGESKTEFWYIVQAEPEAELYLGLRSPVTATEFRTALSNGTAADLVERIPVKAGDSFFIPSGRLHAIGGGNVIVEVQQNSDTTYRVFDWNRVDEKGAPRELHVAEAIQCINFNDCGSGRTNADGESLVQDKLFAVDRWLLNRPRELASPDHFAIALCLRGRLQCEDYAFSAGDFFMLPAAAESRTVIPLQEQTSLLRITIPS